MIVSFIKFKKSDSGNCYAMFRVTTETKNALIGSVVDSFNGIIQVGEDSPTSEMQKGEVIEGLAVTSVKTGDGYKCIEGTDIRFLELV
jgi:hypothetical protein